MSENDDAKADGIMACFAAASSSNGIGGWRLSDKRPWAFEVFGPRKATE